MSAFVVEYARMSDNLIQRIERIGQQLAKATRIACLTGAGISAESGVATFRDANGLWNGFRIEEVATPEAFTQDPQRVWSFYAARRQALLAARPNPGHHALARMKQLCPEFTLITQNVDGLHQQAGSHDLICLHGDIWIDRCNACGWQRRAQQVVETVPTCPACSRHVRPGVVWFGEILPQDALERAIQKCCSAQIMLVVGTSSLVHPAASLATWARQAGAALIEINLEPTPLTDIADESLQGSASNILSALVDSWPQT